MDYARLALLRAEELRSIRGESKQEVNRAGINPDKTVAAGQSFEICKLGGGETALIVSLSLSGGSGDVELRVGKRTLLVRQYSDNMLFMASLNPASFSGSGTSAGAGGSGGFVSISIRPSSRLRLVSAEVMALGGKLLTAGAAEVRVANHAGVTAAVTASEGRIRFSVGEIPDLGRYSLAGFGDSAAVAGITIGDEPYFAVCYVGEFDSSGAGGGSAAVDSRVNLTLFSLQGRVVFCKTLPIKAASLALIGNGTSLILGYITNGIAHAAVIAPPDFVPELGVEIEEAAALEFVKNLPSAVFLEKSNGRILRLSRSEVPSGDCISLFLGAEVE